MDAALSSSELEAFESEASGLYDKSEQPDDKKKKIKGFFKKKAPILSILATLLGIGGIAGGTQLFQPFSLVAQFTETYNSMQDSAKVRSGSFFRYQMMKNGRVRNPTRGKIFGGDTFKITKKQSQRLAVQGIEYDNDYNGERVLKFDDGSGKIKIVTADANTASRLGGDAVDFDTIYRTNSDFYYGYNKGSMTWRGAIANWFDTTTVKFLQSNRITRNLFKDFQKRVQAQNEGNTRSAALDIISKETDEISEGGNTVLDDEEEKIKKELRYNEETEEWEEVEVVKWEDAEVPKKSAKELDDLNKQGKLRIEDNNVQSSPSPGGTVKRDGLTTRLNNIASRVQRGANIACTIFNVVGSINMLITASEMLQVVGLVTSYFESVDKVKAGDGLDTPIHDLTNALNDKKEGNYVTLEGKNIKTDAKSAMESDGIWALYGAGAVDPKNPSVQSFNFSSNVSGIFSSLSTSLELFETCGVAKAAAAIVTATTDAAEILGCILGLAAAPATGGASASTCGGWFLKKIATGIGFGLAINAAVESLIKFITPLATNLLTRDLVKNIGGEDLGNALTSGSNIYMGSTHRANGGSLANREKYIQYAAVHQEVIADNAKYERQNRSPFDATSKYTFVGTLMNQLAKFSTVSSVMSAVTSMSTTVSDSVIAMNTPSAMAYDISKDLMDEATFKETCPYLWSIGAVGDAYCNPFSITDMSTIEMDPSEVINILDDPNGDGDYSDSNFEEEDAANGNVIIKGGSDLAKYINYCGNRTSSFGIVDWNIVNSVSSDGLDSTASTIIGATPVIGDIVDVITNQKALDNAGYVSGESCVAGNTVSKEGSPDWSEAKYYQRFIEDQSLSETMGLFGENGKSAVSVYLDEYYEKNPLDNSYEGILARYSGLTKDDVVALLDFIEYSNYIANYDPSDRYVFGGEVKVNEDKTILFTDENEERFYNIWWYNNIYDRVGRVKARAEKTEFTIC